MSNSKSTKPPKRRKYYLKRGRPPKPRKAPIRPKDVIEKEKLEQILNKSMGRIFDPITKAEAARLIMSRFFLKLALRGGSNEEMGIKEQLEMIFDTKAREVEFYIAKRSFKILGKPSKYVSMRSDNRNVKEGDLLVVRTDQFKPNNIEVQCFTKFNQERDDKWFVLNQSQFSAIKGYIEVKRGT